MVLCHHDGSTVAALRVVGVVLMHSPLLHLGLDVDGVFRVPGDNNELQRLKSAFDAGTRLLLCFYDRDQRTNRPSIKR